MVQISVEVKRLENMVRAVSVNAGIEQPVITFKKDGVAAFNQDKAHFFMNGSHFESKYFASYQVDGDPVKLCFSSEGMLDMLKKMSGDSVTLSFQPGDNLIKLSTKQQTATLPILTPELVSGKLPEFVEYKDDKLTVKDVFQLECKIPSITKEIGYVTGIIGELKVENQALYLFSEEADGTSFKQKIVDVQSLDLSVLFTKDYLSAAFGSMITSEVVVRLAKDFAMCIEDKTSDYSITTLIAPRQRA